MKTVTINVYAYNELSKKAKENVKLYLNLIWGTKSFKIEEDYTEKATRSLWFKNGDIYQESNLK